MVASDIAGIFKRATTDLLALSFQFQHAVSRHIAFAGQLAHALELLVEQLELRQLAFARVLQPANHEFQTQYGFAYTVDVGLELGGVHAHQQLAGLHHVAIFHQNLVNDAARRMLHALAVALGDDRAGDGDTLV